MYAILDTHNQHLNKENNNTCLMEWLEKLNKREEKKEIK